MPLKYFQSETVSSILRLPRIVKRVVAVSVDICTCILATWLALFLRLDQFVALANEKVTLIALSIILVLPIFAATGLYRAIFRYSGWHAITAIAGAMGLYALIYSTIVMAIGIPGVPRTVGIIQPLLLFFGVSGSRLLARMWLGGSAQTGTKQEASPQTVIYGAGQAGRQLARALDSGHEMSVVGFIDDDSRLHGQLLDRLPIFPPQDLPVLMSAKKVTLVLLAMPSISRDRRLNILKYCSDLRVVVRTLPSIGDIAKGRVTINDIKDLEVEDLLGRKSVLPNKILLTKKLTGKVVVVTGAGGSIGSELCRQALALDPKKLLLIEISEFSLYSIHAELEAIKNRFEIGINVEVVPLLGSVQDASRIQSIFSTWKPNTIFHAAAYKHVPLVEQNFVEGIHNNIFGTLAVAEAAIRCNVDDLVLVSTDKAVRPTNVMGATKRLAEMILQALQRRRKINTRLSIVRFGNVLDSSGSVIPKFKAQIREGGPVTVTHPEVTRFFMTIPEAAQLVIQASALAEGGDVFLLDMGEPIKIMDIARQVIRLSGLSEKNTESPDGDIQIEIVGLRPGEKLFEELLIDNDASATLHPKIMRAREKFIPWSSFEKSLSEIKNLTAANDVSASLEVIQRLVDGFAPKKGITDSIHQAKTQSAAS